MKWTPGALDELERAVAEGSRIQLWRRGTEYVVVPDRLAMERGADVLHARHRTSGEPMRFPLEELDGFRVLD